MTAPPAEGSGLCRQPQTAVESVLTQLVDARRFPELVDVRETLRRMRFHHQLRTDDDAPTRQSSPHVALLPALARLVVAASEQTQIVLTTHSSALSESLLARERALEYELQLVGGSTTVTKVV